MAIGLEGDAKGKWRGVSSYLTPEMLNYLGIAHQRVRWSHFGTEDEHGNFVPARRQANGRLANTRPTFAQWARAAGPGVFVFACGGHQMVYRDGQVFDNGARASGSGVHHSRVLKQRARMSYACKIDESELTKTIEAPEWAETAGTHLAAKRAKQGSKAKIAETLILALKRRYEAGKLICTRSGCRRVATHGNGTLCSTCNAKAQAVPAPTPAPVPNLVPQPPKPTPAYKNGKPRTGQGTCKNERCFKKVLARGLCSGCYKKPPSGAGDFGGKVCKNEGCTEHRRVQGHVPPLLASHPLIVNPKRYGKVAEDCENARERAVVRAAESIIETMAGRDEAPLLQIVWGTTKYPSSILRAAFKALVVAGRITIEGNHVRRVS